MNGTLQIVLSFSDKRILNLDIHLYLVTVSLQQFPKAYCFSKLAKCELSRAI